MAALPWPGACLLPALEHRSPVDAGCLHVHVGDALDGPPPPLRRSWVPPTAALCVLEIVRSGRDVTPLGREVRAGRLALFMMGRDAADELMSVDDYVHRSPIGSSGEASSAIGW